MTRASRSFAADGSTTVTAPNGAVAHAAHVEQSDLLARTMYSVAPGVWCLVGNGLANQTFIDAPDGIIAVDTGESVQEMEEALRELRAVTERPIAAVLYTHFHYVTGTGAVDGAGSTVPVVGHERIAQNLRRATAEIGPTYGRGVVEQFGTSLPTEGADALVNVGLARFYRNPAHAPFTPGFVAPTVLVREPCELQIAGMTVHVHPAPSDSDDSVTYWFPELGVAVHNLVWPALFNVFAIRGEEYRDPRVVVAGFDHLVGLGAEHLVGTHGPPISGAAEIRARVTRLRDAIEFLWDQTVRLTNQGRSGAEIAHAIRLPDHCDDDPITAELYGVAEHHVRQIRSGLFGFFDGDPAGLFPLEPHDEARRVVEGFGGSEEVRRRVRIALDADDLRWGVRLAAWLVRSDDDEHDRHLLAEGLRLIAQRTSAANIRNWCLTRALALEGTIDPTRLTRHRFTARALLARPMADSLPVLRVMVDPGRAVGLDVRVAWRFDDGSSGGLHVRNGVAVPITGSDADVVLECSAATWAAVLAGDTTLGEAITSGALRIDGDLLVARRALAVFELDSLRD